MSPSAYPGEDTATQHISMANKTQLVVRSVSEEFESPLLWTEAQIPDKFKKLSFRRAWVAQSVKQPTLGFGSDHDLTVL